LVPDKSDRIFKTIDSIHHYVVKSTMQKQKPTIVFIGAGNMASSIIGGLIKTGYPKDKIIACAPTEVNLKLLREKYDIRLETNNQQAACQADILVFCVKPQILQAVCTELRTEITEYNPLIITIAAGIETHPISHWIGGKPAIVRCMPNTPALIGKGASGLFANAFVTDAQKQEADAIFSAVGITEWVNKEYLMHTVTAISGSGPAYFFMIMESMEKAARDAGLSGKTAHRLTTQTLLGAAAMALSSELTPAELKRNVMSPGGTTEQAIKSFEEGSLATLFENAISSALLRSKEIAKNFGEK